MLSGYVCMSEMDARNVYMGKVNATKNNFFSKWFYKIGFKIYGKFISSILTESVNISTEHYIERCAILDDNILTLKSQLVKSDNELTKVMSELEAALIRNTNLTEELTDKIIKDCKSNYDISIEHITKTKISELEAQSLRYEERIHNLTLDYDTKLSTMYHKHDMLEKRYSDLLISTTEATLKEKVGKPALICSQVVACRKAHTLHNVNSTLLSEILDLDQSTVSRMLSGKTYRKCTEQKNES